MDADILDKLGPMLAEVGKEAAVIVGGDPDGLYFYAEVEEGGAVFASVFMDEKEAVRYYDPTHELLDLIVEAWEMSSPKERKRWIVMEYQVVGTKFDVTVRYKEEIDPDSFVTDRRRAALKARYGDKKIIYPPIPEEMLRGGPL